MSARTTADRGRDRAPVAAAPIRRVRIGDPQDPTVVRVLRLRWLCPLPHCRRPRGEIRHEVHAHHDARGRVVHRTRVDRWDLHPDCGHVRLNGELLAEAAQLAAETDPHVPAPRSPS